MKLIADTHCHTVASTHAYSTILENVAAAKKKGLKYIAVTDHTGVMPGAPGCWYFQNLSVVPREIDGVKILKGIESNVLGPSGRIDIPEFNEKIITSHDIRFAGLQGALSYKSGILGYTHESSLRAIENMSDADIFITHAPVWDEDNYNAAIAGLKGISEYIYKNHIPYHFCGHIGEKITKTLSNGCVSQSVNGSLVITI